MPLVSHARSSRSSSALAFCLLLLAGGCDSVEKATQEHRAAASARLEALSALAADAKARPRVEKGEVAVPEGAVMNFQSRGEANAGVLPLEALEHPCAGHGLHWKDPAWKEGPETRFLFPSGTSENWHQQSACLLDGQTIDALTPDEAGRRFSRLEAIEYVALVRFDSLDVSKVLVSPKEGVDGTYTGGLLAGDVLVYQVEGGKYLGGFPFEARNKDVVEVRGLENQSLRNDLLEQLRFSLNTAFTENIPGVKAP